MFLLSLSSATKSQGCFSFWYYLVSKGAVKGQNQDTDLNYTIKHHAKNTSENRGVGWGDGGRGQPLLGNWLLTTH